MDSDDLAIIKGDPVLQKIKGRLFTYAEKQEVAVFVAKHLTTLALQATPIVKDITLGLASCHVSSNQQKGAKTPEKISTSSNKDMDLILAFTRLKVKKQPKPRLRKGGRVLLLKILQPTKYPCNPADLFHSKSYTDLSRVLYAVFSDCHYRPVDCRANKETFTSIDSETHFQVHVITFLQLLGGLPATSEMISLPKDFEYQHFVSVVDSVAASAKAKSPARYGGTSGSSGSWSFQEASTILSTNVYGEWTPVSVDTFSTLKAKRSLPVFLIHSSHLPIAAAVKTKAAANPEIWVPMPEPGDSHAFPPPEYIPATLKQVQLPRNAPKPPKAPKRSKATAVKESGPDMPAQNFFVEKENKKEEPRKEKRLALKLAHQQRSKQE